ncbi:FAD-dependent oxidoreductase [Bacillus sp. N9]
METFASQTLGATDIMYRWSAQDLETPDYIPYIGRISEGHKNIFVATGFKKWGMTTSTIAALLLTDLIKGKRIAILHYFPGSIRCQAWA